MRTVLQEIGYADALLARQEALNDSVPSEYAAKHIRDLVERFKHLAKFLQDLSHSLDL
jgi:hypothetical protein